MSLTDPATSETTGQQTLRAENVSKVVDGFALQEYRLKQVVMVQSSSAWKETYMQESKADLTATGEGSNIKGVPRLANFPHGEVDWVEKSKRHAKYGMEGNISWEDKATNSIDVMARTLLRISRAVTKAVDDEIWDVISESQSASLINSVTITGGNEWDSGTAANRDPIQDILNAKKEIALDNYDSNRNGFLLLNPTDYANLLGNSKVSNNASYRANDVVANGNVGSILGLKIIVSNSITNDYAMVIIGQEAATWKSASPLKTVTIEEPGIQFIIRSWEVGVCQLTNPEAICLIDNTQA